MGTKLSTPLEEGTKRAGARMTAASIREKTLTCSICQFLWGNYSHHGGCHATDMMPAGLQKS